MEVTNIRLLLGELVGPVKKPDWAGFLWCFDE